MSSRAIRGPLRYNSNKTVLSGDYVVVNESLIIVNKTSGAATQITLPPSLAVATTAGRREVIIVDGKGDAGSNNITVVPTGADTINGGSSYVMGANYSRARFIDVGGGVWTAAAGVELTSTQAAFLSGVTAGTAAASKAVVLDSALNVATINTITTNTVVVGTLNSTTNNVAGLTTHSDVVTVNAAGSVIGNAAAVTHAVNIIAGADDTKGIILPTPVAGKEIEVYSTTTNGLKVYPAVNATINDGTANSNITLKGRTPARFVATNSVNWAAFFTTN